MDVATLIEDVSEESPCGENLEYDPEFGELERSGQGKPEQSIGDTTIPAEEPDWADVQKRAIHLLSRTKDLRVAVYLAQAQLHTGGFSGFADALHLVRSLIEKYWETIYPPLDPEDGNDPRMRVNAINALSDHDGCLRAIRETTLATSPKLHSTVSYRDIEIATGALRAKKDAQEPAVDLAAINATFMDCDPESLASRLEAVTNAAQSVLAIEAFVANHVGPSNAPSLDNLANLLSQIQNVLAEKSEARGVNFLNTASNDEMRHGLSNDESTVSPQPAAQVAPSINGQIINTKDVVRALDMICTYYERNEPSSPIPLLMRRARGLVAKDFMEILRDLVPDGLSQAESIKGQSADDSGDAHG